MTFAIGLAAALLGAVASLASSAPGTLTVEPSGERISVPSEASGDENNWMLVGVDDPQAAPLQKTACCGYSDPWRPDVMRNFFPYVGLKIEASRSFRVNVQVFSNLGDFVDRFTFSISPGEFEKLPPGSVQDSRVMRVLWKGRGQNGRVAGTGAYVLKYSVTLNAVPGVADERVAATDVMRVGLLRP